MKDYKGQVVLITGASSGIGAEFARQLARRGADLILIARRAELLKKIQDELVAEAEVSVQVYSWDLTSENDLQAAVNLIQAQRVDLLVNNAGKGSFGYFETLDITKEIAQINLNIVATVRLLHAVLPQMKERQAGGIISVSSIAAFQPLPLMATYAATKAFNFMHTMALRDELKEFGIKVLTLCPGPTATEFGGVARVPGTISGVGRDNVKMVVEQAIRALGCNNPFVVTGLRSQLLSWVSRILPKSFSTAFVGRGLKQTLAKSNAR